MVRVDFKLFVSHTSSRTRAFHFCTAEKVSDTKSKFWNRSQNRRTDTISGSCTFTEVTGEAGKKRVVVAFWIARESVYKDYRRFNSWHQDTIYLVFIKQGKRRETQGCVFYSFRVVSIPFISMLRRPTTLFLG